MFYVNLCVCVVGIYEIPISVVNYKQNQLKILHGIEDKIEDNRIKLMQIKYSI